MPTQQISGTIYQMYDASGNNKRFPVTVVDGVLGLASYLQEQFSSLANLYMGINDVALSGTVLTVKGVSVNLATVTDLSNYYTKTEADGRFLGITANAASATKLQTARTIWGQSFDGTANVTGAMSGVTSIDSVINIDNGYVGIGKTPSVALDVNGQVKGTQLVSTVTSSAPLVVGSTSLVTNLNADLLDGSHLSDILAMDITGNAKTATNPKSELKTDQEIVFRKTNVEWDAKSGVIKKIKGKTLAWNQLVEPATISESTFTDGVKVNTDGAKVIIEIAAGGATATRDIYGFANYGWQISGVSGHKRIFYGAPDNAINAGIKVVNGYTQTQPNSIISEAANAVDYGLRIPQGTPEGTYVFYPQVTDLTLAGLDSITAADFLALYPDYHPYNPGTLISNDAEAVETTGVNQWDEEWENGYYDISGFHADARFIASKNKIAVIPGETYYFKCPAIRFEVIGYDAEGNYFQYIGTAISNSQFIIPIGINYITFNSAYVGDLTTYNHDICINLSNATINGQYFPYKKSRINLGLKNIKVVSPNVWDEEWESGTLNTDGTPLSDADFIRSKNFIGVEPGQTYYVKGDVQIFEYGADYGYIDRNFVDNNTIALTSQTRYIKWRSAEGVTTYSNNITINLSDPAFNGRYFPYGTLNLEGGVKGAGSAYDEIRDGKKHHKRIGRVDLGSLVWLYDTDTQRFYTSFSVAKFSSGHSNAVCSNYAVSQANFRNMPDKSLTLNMDIWSAGQFIIIRDDTHSAASLDGNGHASWLEGVMLYFELANEEVYDLAEPLPSVYPCDQFGTERVISPVSVTPSAPFCADIQYGAKSDDIAKELIDTRAVVDTLLTSERPALFSTVTATDAIRLAGTTAAKKRLYFSDSVYLELDSNGLHLHGAGFYSDSFISAFGTNQTI